MPVNLAETKFFEICQKHFEANPSKPLEEQTIAEYRQGPKFIENFTGAPADIDFLDTYIPARDGYKIPIRIYNNNSTIKPVLVVFPGCGYTVDLFEPNAIAASRIAKYADIKVIIVNFRLAPEYPLPTAIYDGYDVTQYLFKHAEKFNIDASKICIGGYSSGAHCAAVISNLAKNDSSLYIHHQILLNGFYDLTESCHDYESYEKEDKLCRREISPVLFKFFGIPTSEYTNPIFSPYYEKDFSILPRTTIIISEYDGLRSDSEAYFEKIKKNNAQVEKIIITGQTHNTLIMRDVMNEGPDPAEVIANVIRA